MIQEFIHLYKKVISLYSIHPKLIPNWLMIKNETYSIFSDTENMPTEDVPHICDELIIISKELDYGVTQFIPIPSFDTNSKPQYIILPYKKNFIIKFNDTHEETIIYKVYFQSMKCMNIINTNSINVNYLNSNFKNWIVNTVCSFVFLKDIFLQSILISKLYI